MTAAPDLFSFADPRFPAWYLAPQSELERRFVVFDRANPRVYAALERLALKEVAGGAKRLGIAKLAEQLRADPDVSTQGDAWKINNSFRALYARLLIHRHPILDGIIECRGRREKGGTAA